MISLDRDGLPRYNRDASYNYMHVKELFMKIKALLSAILASLMLAGSLASCANNDPAETQSPDGTTSAVESETELTDNLPDDLNYGGTTITVISRARLGWFHDEILVEKLTGDPVNDAVYERNKLVESRLNVKIANITDDSIASESVPDKVSTAVKAGTDEY